MSEQPERVGDYEIEATLGSGGMATVYRVRHVFLDTHHALKLLDPRYRVVPEMRRRFLDEAKIQAKHLDHPNIVKVTTIVATAEHAALVMELVEGSTLEAELGRLRERPDEIRRIMLAVLDAVGHAHAHGIVHRDLKPANVLLQRKGGALLPKVTDFGIAKVSAEVAGQGKKSTHGDTRMGTLGYMSPEQIRRAKDVTPRSDIFSLGAVLYELATGEPPFAGDSDYDVMDAIVNVRYEPPERRYERIDPALAAVIRRALEPDPARRFASCDEMAAALRGEAVGAGLAGARTAPATGTGSGSGSRSASGAGSITASGSGSGSGSATGSASVTSVSSSSVTGAGSGSGRSTGLIIGLAAAGLVLGGVAIVIAGRAAGRGARAHPPADAGQVASGDDADAVAAETGADALAVAVDPSAVAAVAEPPAADPPPAAAAPTCPDGMVLVRGVSFAMGPPDDVGRPDERPRHTVELASFCIDRTEVTAGAYAACATCPPLPSARLCNFKQGSRRNYPASCVRWSDATDYCRSVGKRLPTEPEWELAAAGAEGRTYPWGADRPSTKHVNWWHTKKYSNTSPTGALPAGATPDGIVDLAGNVAEWVADELAPYPSSAQHEPPPVVTSTPAAKKLYVIRGGSWRSQSAADIRTSARASLRGTSRPDTIGFRCARAPG
jgi:serine/threonine-protein kinase